jgi:uncharacterized membrane protein YdjX (TVP38/TMEM64 family)
MSPSSSDSVKKKLPLVKLAVGFVILAAVAVLLLRGADFRAWINATMDFIRACGPLAFFTAMAVLPVIGMPMSFFTFPAGEAFAAQMTMPGVIAAAFAALAVGLVLGYWLARYALRPVLVRLLKRFGYEVPRVDQANALSMILVLRLTPGAPYCVQNFILGVAEVPFGLYLWVSWVCAIPYFTAGIILGKGMLQGNFKMVGLAIGVIVVAVVGIKWLRQRYVKQRES